MAFITAPCIIQMNCVKRRRRFAHGRQPVNIPDSFCTFTTPTRIAVSDTGVTGSLRAAAGPEKPLSRGPIRASFRMRRDRDQRHREGRKRGEVCPLTIRLDGLGERRKLPQRSPGRSPGRKWILCTLAVRNKPSGTPFTVFVSDAPTSRGPGKLPLDRPAAT